MTVYARTSTTLYGFLQETESALGLLCSQLQRFLFYFIFLKEGKKTLEDSSEMTDGILNSDLTIESHQSHPKVW